MKSTYLFGALVWSVANFSEVLAAEPDSTSVEQLNEVVVRAVKAPKNAPFAVSRVEAKELQQFSRTGQELPFLFARTPGVVAWSENGLGTGTTYMRLRGAADSRINVTLDGVSLNSPEDQCVFWANMNSYAALLSEVQIQRGVGSSTNGDGAFGGTVALKMKTPSLLPKLEFTGSYGSYNTYNAGGSFSSGLLWKHLVIDGAYHHTGTDGYVHGTQGASGSYYAGISWFNTEGNLKVSYKHIGNYEHTGQAWNSVTAGNDDYSMNVYDGVRTYDDLVRMGLGRYNSLCERFEPDWQGGWTLRPYLLSDGTPWKSTTDNFWQNRSLLNLAWQIDDHWNMSGTLHYTHGYGYYEEFRYNKKLGSFGLPTFTLTDGSVLKRTDFIRKKGLTQDTYGMLWNANYRNNRWDVTGGAAFQSLDADHWGYLTYTGNEELSRKYLADGAYRYYDSGARKNDMSLFLKVTMHLNQRFDVFADAQYRYVSFMTGGINDRFYENGDGTFSNQRLDIDRKYDFVNPKIGMSYHVGGHKAYLSYAMANREPERNNFTDNGAYPAPKPEQLHDVELGYSHNGNGWHVGFNLYAMAYRNQFVQTGLKSDIGENLTTNVKKSYRMGVELTGSAELTRWLSLEANAALSRNRITDFDEVIETYDDDWNDLPSTTRHYENSTLAFSPSVVLNGFADFHFKGFQAIWHTGFVGRQFLDNTGCKERSLPKYSRTDVHLTYTMPVANKGLKQIQYGLDLNNIFNRHYATSGWVYSSIVGQTYPEQSRYYQIGYIPTAGFTAMGSVKLKF